MAPRYSPTYSGQTKGIPEWMKKAGTYTHTYGGGPNAETEIKYDPSRVGNIDWKKEQEGAYEGLAGLSAYGQAYGEMFPDEAPEADFSGYDTALGRLSQAQGGLSDILGYGRSEAQRAGTLAAAAAAQRGYGGWGMGQTPGADATRQAALDRASSQYAQQMMGVYGKQAELDVGRTTAEENARRFGISRTDQQQQQMMNRYDQQQQLEEQKRRWEEEMKFKQHPTTTRVTQTDRWGQPAGGTTTTSGRPGYTSLLGRIG